ncbi:phosphoenolpyruvate synthase [Vulcanibacillus modesticaldus]|uniref:Phosphoenolpyruvate synthase n=1 Tax=Vulcanibacillus modesticaldus TaxID=337097 RepID=A0A1D2YT50_9BACI|nr:phosphoenolpyruvate synthase [Vulcanibacillus modesticaldus]OEF98857.1 phosphoenolpyruvate synthase [Vulcanibacillus modesticaldus]
MKKDVLFFQEIDKNSLKLVGGKGANLGELTRAGFSVPEGFCVTTEAFDEFIKNSSEMEDIFNDLAHLDMMDIDQLSKLGSRIRQHLLTLDIPKNVEKNIIEAWQAIGEDYAYAVRSSATAEDLPSHSFAGQQDTYLNIKGEDQLLIHVRKCWASLFTDRAIAYRAKNGFDHRKVRLSVVIQRMVNSEVSGIMFTADPITGHREIVSVDANFGLGEALVSGLVSADLYQVRNNKIIKKQIADKKIAILPNEDSGTTKQELDLGFQKQQALTDQQIIELAKIGKEIEKYYGKPQDIEWCLLDGKFYIVQSRPITSLYPVPEVDDERLHVFFSFGHQQMMTEAIKPLGISVLRTFFPFGKPGNNKAESNVLLPAGGHLFVDLTNLFTIKRMQTIIPELLGQLDQLIGSALKEFVNRPEFLQKIKKDAKVRRAFLKNFIPVITNIFLNMFVRNPYQAIDKADRYIEQSVVEFKEKLAKAPKEQKILAIQDGIGSVFMKFLQDIFPYPAAGIGASKILAKLSQKWLGDAIEVEKLNKSLPGNVTSEMGLALGDVADIARKTPELIKYLEDENLDSVGNINFSDVNPEFDRAFQEYLAKYGMRCSGEIDITKKRWYEDPKQLFPAIVSQIKSYQPGEHREKFIEGKKEAEQAAKTLINRVRQRPMGFFKAKIISRLINVFRNLMGIREHGKFMFIQIMGIYKKTILELAEEFVETGLLTDKEDIYYFSLDELNQLFNGNISKSKITEIIKQRKAEFEQFTKLTPPRVITSDGEIITGTYQVEAPQGALIGSPVSIGVIEGRAKVLLRPDQGQLNKGEILVAPFTDPGWTPLFLSAAGLVMEVGGLMTHGAVVAREYGIPAVVGVENATKIIKDGQYIRVNGNKGYVEILDE